MVEEVLVVRPMDPRVLWYAGMVAFLDDRPQEARDRWTKLLSLNPPAAVADVLKAQLAEMDGGVALPESNENPPAESTIRASVALADGVEDKVTPQAMVFMIARNPAGGPPIAVTRHSPTALPGDFSLTDANAMLPGSSLSQFPELEVVVRLSLTGEPIAKPGDWYASAIVTPGAAPVELLIDQQVE